MKLGREAGRAECKECSVFPDLGPYTVHAWHNFIRGHAEVLVPFHYPYCGMCLYVIMCLLSLCDEESLQVANTWCLYGVRVTIHRSQHNLLVDVMLQSLSDWAKGADVGVPGHWLKIRRGMQGAWCH